jgi:hypothetical protein
MNCTKIFWLGFAVGPLLMWQNVFATDHAPLNRPSAHRISGVSRTTSTGDKRRSTAKHARSDKNRGTDNRGAHNDYRSGYVAGLRDGKPVAVQNKRSIRTIRAADQVAAREQVERDARSERIYRSSQLSAPIIIDAKACKRIGIHGESIYENCQLAQHQAGR